MIVVVTTVREIPEGEEEDLYHYLAAAGALLEASGYPSPYDVEALRNTKRSHKMWVDDYKKWRTTTTVEVIEGSGN